MMQSFNPSLGKEIWLEWLSAGYSSDKQPTENRGKDPCQEQSSLAHAIYWPSVLYLFLISASNTSLN